MRSAISRSASRSSSLAWRGQRAPAAAVPDVRRRSAAPAVLRRSAVPAARRRSAAPAARRKSAAPAVRRRTADASRATENELPVARLSDHELVFADALESTTLVERERALVPGVEAD